MKTLIRHTAIYSFALYILPGLIPGVHMTGGLWTLFLGGFSLTLLFFIIKPIINIISFPFNIITLGLFSLLINAFILYLLTIFITGISITPFSYNRFEILGFVIPALSFNTFFAYVFTAAVLSIIESFLKWLMR